MSWTSNGADKVAVTSARVLDDHDPVAHPPHYVNGPVCPGCGAVIECITVAERMSFARGNVIKYLWRAGFKGSEIEDLRKARQYLDFEIARLEREGSA